jgi:sulfotransferase
LPKYHFIAGLPRSGSTLLAAILNQNPAFSAAMSGPVFPVVNAALTAMGGGNEYAVFMNDTQKKRMLRGLLDGYYADTPARVIFDTNRMWTARLAVLRLLYPGARVIACVRNPAWVLDSIETLVRKNALDTMRLFGNDAERMSVYARANGLMERNRLVGSAYLALKEAFYSQEAAAMLLLNYDALVSHPQEAMQMVYQFLDEPAFAHDFENVSYTAEVFDTFMLAKGLHDVKGRVEHRPRPSILPPDLFKRFAAMEFWSSGGSPATVIATAAQTART